MKKIKFEFYSFDGSILNQTLNLGKPISIYFIFTSGIGSTVKINNSYKLGSISDFNNGIQNLPYELNLNLNENEVDTTQYTLIFSGGGTLNVVCKYLVK